MSNNNLHKALKNKNDEFYTFEKDIEKECKLYIPFYKNKIIFLPCDTEESYFWKYFISNFYSFSLKEVIACHLEEPKSYALIFDGNKIEKIPLNEKGDFFSKESQSFLSKSDIVITNPPFSVEKEIISNIIKNKKDFLLVGNENLITAKEIFPLFIDKKIFFGANQIKKFFNERGEEVSFGNIFWFSSFLSEKKEVFSPTKTFSNVEDKMKKYDNYEALNIDKIQDIPNDYFGVMGVPITYLKKHNPSLFEIKGIASGISKKNRLYGEVIYHSNNLDRGGAPLIEGKIKYTRVFIQRKEKE